MTYAAARPLARLGVPPNALTLCGPVVAAAAIPPAAAGGRWPLLGALLVLASGLVDGLDGTVAVLTGRVTRFGFVLDSVADRLSDAAHVWGVWALGAPGPIAVAAGVGLGLLEYARARAGAAGMAEIGVVTVGERPTRILVVAVTLACAAAYVGAAEMLATLGAAAILGLSLIALAQFLAVTRRTLR